MRKLTDIIAFDPWATYQLLRQPPITMRVGTLCVDITREALLAETFEAEDGCAYRIRSLVALARQGELRAGQGVDIELVPAG